MCRCSTLFVVGVLVLVMAALAATVGFCAPFWSVNFFDFLKIFRLATGSKGLWASCIPENSCYWYFENDFQLEKDLPAWHKAAQGLYGVGLLLLLVGLLIGLIQLFFCGCCKDSSSVVSTLGSICISSACLIASAIGVYGGYARQENGFDSFYWAFFVAIGGAVTAVVAAILFFCESCPAHSYSGYHVNRVV